MPMATAVSSFPYAAFSYDAAWLVFYGAAWAEIVHGRVTGSTIADGLRHVSSGTALPVSVSMSWGMALTAFETETSVDLVGASGSLDFDPVTEETATPIEVWRISGMDASATIELDHVYDP